MQRKSGTELLAGFIIHGTAPQVRSFAIRIRMWRHYVFRPAEIAIEESSGVMKLTLKVSGPLARAFRGRQLFVLSRRPPVGISGKSRAEPNWSMMRLQLL